MAKLTNIQDDFVFETRTKRRGNRTKSPQPPTKRRPNARTRRQGEPAVKTRATRSTARKPRGSSHLMVARSTMPTRRVTRSSANQQDPLPLHHHGIHPDVGPLHDHEENSNMDEGSNSSHGAVGQCLTTPWQVFEPVFTLQEDAIWDSSSEFRGSETMSDK